MRGLYWRQRVGARRGLSTAEGAELRLVIAYASASVCDLQMLLVSLAEFSHSEVLWLQDHIVSVVLPVGITVWKEA